MGVQIKRLIKEWKEKGLKYKKRESVGATVPKYKPEDIALLIKTDVAHRTPNGNAVRAILRRELLTFGKERETPYAKLKTIPNVEQYLKLGITF